MESLIFITVFAGMAVLFGLAADILEAKGNILGCFLAVLFMFIFAGAAALEALGWAIQFKGAL